MAEATSPSADALNGAAVTGVTAVESSGVNSVAGYVKTLAVQSSNVRAAEYQSSSLIGGNVYNALFNASLVMEARLAESLETFQEHPDVQANLQQLQYDLQQWNLTLTTMSNINKNFGDALKSIASNFR